MANRRSNRILGASRSNSHQSRNQSLNQGRQASASFQPETRQPTLAPPDEVLLPRDPPRVDDIPPEHPHVEFPLPPPRRRPPTRQDDELADTASSTHPSRADQQHRIPPDAPEGLARPHIAELPRNALRHELQRLVREEFPGGGVRQPLRPWDFQESSPLTEAILQHPIPARFKLPSIDPYDGTSDLSFLPPSASGPAKCRASSGDPAKSRASGGGPAKSRASGGGPAKCRDSGGCPAKNRATGGGPAKSRASGGDPAKSRASDEGVSQVAMQCSRLVSLTLYRCNITDIGLEMIANFCNLLENLNLSYCVNITDCGIHALSRGCRLLHVLVVSCCRDVVGTGLRGCSQRLEYIEAECCMFTREGLLEAVSAGGLKYLNLSSPRCSMNIDGIALVLAPRLQFLNLRLCRFISNESVATISRSCPLLEEWSLAVCHEIGALGWEEIGLNCSNLKVLHVNRCRNLCDRGLASLRDGCGRLRVLYIHGCKKVSHMGLELFRLRRHDVEIRSEEHVSIGPRIYDFFA
ncbi:hypothetical protein IEQ34_019067 [Dendrobium chrysotoxum]|uniref:F-box/LRR-repeat protein n=1 Tax=Dendrobium chrysotoxum TaxID=161865 RepID=A0AAV7G7M7_DENCH|nr:hypothetical protein IEQ34_019067 [Dendrobium chrysotoxum]